jgi:formylmethanofuran dehydrogenase subunit E
MKSRYVAVPTPWRDRLDTLRHCQICGAKIRSKSWNGRKNKELLCRKCLQKKYRFGFPGQKYLSDKKVADNFAG